MIESETTFSEDNALQVEGWNGVGGDQWASNQDRYDRLLEPFNRPLEAASGIASDHRVLDIGCGCGATTIAAARTAHAGDALGLDLSAPMLKAAGERATAHGVTNVAFEQGDAQIRPFAAEFDRVISRFGVMFFADPDAAFANIARGLRPGGRLVFVCWQPLERNEWLSVPIAAALAHVPVPPMGGPGDPGPHSLDDPDRIRRLLTPAGLTDIDIAAADVSMLVAGGGPIEEVIPFMRRDGLCRRLLANVDADTEVRALDAIAAALAPHATSRGIELPGAAWVVTARR